MTRNRTVLAAVVAVLAAFTLTACNPGPEGCFYNSDTERFFMEKYEWEQDVPDNVFEADISNCLGDEPTDPEGPTFDEPEFD